MALLYNMYAPSNNKNSLGVAYPNPFSFNLNNFSPEKPVSSYSLTESDINRFDILIYNIYGSTRYESLILMLNTITDIHSMSIGDIIYLWETTDMDNFITETSQLAL